MTDTSASERALILTGRVQALKEAFDMTQRVMSGIDPAADTEVMLRQFVVGSGELLTWLVQSADEAEGEARLITDELEGRANGK